MGDEQWCGECRECEGEWKCAPGVDARQACIFCGSTDIIQWTEAQAREMYR